MMDWSPFARVGRLARAAADQLGLKLIRYGLEPDLDEPPEPTRASFVFAVDEDAIVRTDVDRAEIDELEAMMDATAAAERAARAGPDPDTLRDLTRRLRDPGQGILGDDDEP